VFNRSLASLKFFISAVASYASAGIATNGMSVRPDVCDYYRPILPAAKMQPKDSSFWQYKM